MLVRGSRDGRAAAIADVQRGVLSRDQLRQAGIPDSAIGRMVAAGRLYRLHAGVYALGHRQLPPLGRETAALLAVGPGAALSHVSAAQLWRLLPFTKEHKAHVVVVGRRIHSRSGICVHHALRLEARDLRRRDGLPVTSPARTVLDLADEAADRELERAVEEALTQRLVRPADLEDVLARAVGRHGARRLAALLGAGVGRTQTRSEAEERMLGLIRQAGLPAPEVNARIHGYEVDFLWRSQRLVLELDGFRFHSTRAAFERDRRKGAALTAAGLRVMRSTWVQTEREPVAVMVRVAQALIAV